MLGANISLSREGLETVEGHLIHWLVILVVVALFYGGRKIPEVMRRLGEDINRRGGPPTHPLPVSSPIETSRGSGDANKPLG
jgi:hypothetical protein